MFISSAELRSHFRKSDEAHYLYNFAVDAGFLEDKHGSKEWEIEMTLNALRMANVQNLSELDEFVKNNIERLESFYLKILKQNESGWVAPYALVYLLMVIFKDPLAFTKADLKKIGIDDYLVEILEKVLSETGEL